MSLTFSDGNVIIYSMKDKKAREKAMPKRNASVVWVKAPCDKEVREKLTAKFDKCSFVFETNDIDFSLKSVEIIIGEPSENEIL